MKRIIRIVKWLVIGFVLIVVLSILLSILFQNRIETAALSQLDKLTNSQLTYGNAEFNYINSFPSISLNLENPTFYDNDYDAALELEEFQVRLNLFKSIFSDPVISRLVIKTGSVTLRERNKRWNIEDLMTGDKAAPSNGSLINIDELIVENFKVIVDRGTADQITQLNLEAAEMELKSTTEQVNIFAQGRMSFDYIIDSGDHQEIKIFDSFQADLSFDRLSKIVSINSCQLDQGLTLTGWFNSINSQRDMKLDIHKLKLNSLNTWLHSIAKVDNQLIQLQGDISGIVTFDQVSDIDYTLYVNDGELEHRDVDLSEFESTITGDQHEVRIDKLELEVEKEQLIGSVLYSIKQNKLVSLTLDGDIPVKPLYNFTQDTLLKKVKGNIDIHTFSIHQYPFGTDRSILNYTDFNGEFVNVNVESNIGKSLKIKGGEIETIDEEFHFKNLQVEMDNSTFDINGLYVIEENRNVIKCQLEGDKIQATDVFAFSYTEPTDNSNFLESNRIYVNATIDDLYYNDVHLEDAQVDLRSINNVLTTSVVADVFDGTLQSDGRLKHNGESYQYHMTMDGKGIDLEKLLAQNKNFGQDIITSKHLKGTLTSLASFDLYYDDQWNLLPKKTKGLISANIKNGRIKDLEMMKQFSSFVNIRDLQDIKFTELDNYLEIQGKNLYIPTMFIQSNAANFMLSGYHSIENVQLYYLKVNAGQILANKFKKHNPALPPKPDKRHGMFNMHYVVNGTSESYEYTRDRSRVKSAFVNGEDRKRLIYQELVKEFGSSDRLVFEELN